MAERGEVARRCQWQRLVEVAHDQFLAVVAERQLACLQRGAERPAKARIDELARVHVPIAIPVDIEEIRKPRALTEAKDIPPPRVQRAEHPNVVWDDVQNETHVVMAQSAVQHVERFNAAKFRVHAVTIDDVIAVGAARDGGENRREVNVRDSEGGKLRHRRRRVRQRELGVQLQPVRGHRYFVASAHARSLEIQHARTGTPAFATE